MRAAILMFWAWVLVGAATTTPAAEFVPGHVYVTVAMADPCDFGGEEAILEIDPVTGETSIFADSSDGICAASGLAFTPDGRHLRLLSAGHLLPFDLGWIQEFDADGNGTVILDESDGLGRPFGYDGVAFDADGNFFVVNTIPSQILWFPVGGGPAEVFADEEDGLYGRGSLAFDPVSGDLFYAGDLDGVILRITPQGEASIFDIPLQEVESPLNVVFDSVGNLFVSTQNHDWPDDPGRAIYRYDGADPRSGRLLASEFSTGWNGPAALTISADDTQLYFAVSNSTEGGRLYGVDTMDGTTTLLTEFTIFPNATLYPTGIAVYDPGSLVGDLDNDGDMDFIDFGVFQRCFTGADGGPVAPECGSADLDNDSDVDLDDFAAFQAALMSP